MASSTSTSSSSSSCPSHEYGSAADALAPLPDGAVYDDKLAHVERIVDLIERGTPLESLAGLVRNAKHHLDGCQRTLDDATREVEAALRDASSSS